MPAHACGGPPLPLQWCTSRTTSLSPFGQIREGQLSDLTDLGFTGQRHDDSTGGLMHYGARYYLSELRRFISPDTIVPGAGNPQALNRYAYVVNNPVKYIDPSGHVFMIDENTYYKPLYLQWWLSWLWWKCPALHAAITEAITATRRWLQGPA